MKERMKKKTPTQKYIDETISKAKEELAGNHISGCNVHMEVNMGEAVELIAEGLIENAKALRVLAESVKNQNVYAFYIDGSN